MRRDGNGGVELVAELESARSELVRIEREASAAVAAARSRVVVAQSRVDVFRRDLVAQHATAWRRHTVVLRERAVEAGDATQVVSVAVSGGLEGSRMEPRLTFVRNVLSDEAAAADRQADWLSGYLLRGDQLAGSDLERLVSQLEPLPEAAETVAA